MLVPNIKDRDQLAHHIGTMFYIIGGVASLLFLLVIIGKGPGTSGGPRECGPGENVGTVQSRAPPAARVRRHSVNKCML